MNIVWIPGWQFSAQAFQPLWRHAEVTEPNVLDYAAMDLTLSQWLDKQVQHLDQDTVLVGWSLGGMLACELAKRSSKVQKVLAICANTRFAGGPGLANIVADSFMSRYQRNPAITRKKFAALVDRQQVSEIENSLLDGNHLNTLEWLYELNITEELACPIHVLLAEQDQLVPVTSAQQAWQPLAQTVTILSGEHSLPITSAAAVAQWVGLHG
ncbi:MAG: alpha/beta fold hydrolase [Reinekea sp.]